MKRVMSLLLLAAALCVPGFAAEKDGDEDGLIDAKTEELVAGKETRFEKISALYAFVRDDITQIKTEYG